MLICSIIIIVEIFKTHRKLKKHANKSGLVFKKRINKNRQITYLLLTTNFIFFFLVTPLVVINAMRDIQEDTVKTTIIYILAYANHG